jgi:hypothetical protein
LIKYGLLFNEKNENIGDDIQSYAEAQFLPRVDVICDRENLDTFKYKDGKDPVALIMGAWFMWHKYNWPPSKQIVPLNVGFHHFNREKKLEESSSYAVPMTTEHYSGVGGEWFKSYGKVGCRDYYTCGVFDSMNIPNYFSGCVTLTLPIQKETKDKGKYIVLVDLNPKVEKKVIKLSKGKFEIRKVSHITKNIAGATWEERVKRVEEYLTLYQNAAYVVTRRLHVALPCLAMGVPVMVIQSVKMNDPNRFEPYREWLHYARNKSFLKNGYPDFDFEKGTPNKDDYVKTREELTKTIKDFIDYCEKNKKQPLEFFDKTTYTDLELYKWKSDLMKRALLKTHLESKKLFVRYIKEPQKEKKTQKVLKYIYSKTIKKTKLKDTKLIKKLRAKVKKPKKK